MIAVLAYFTGSMSFVALACGHSAEAMWDVLALITRHLRRAHREGATMLDRELDCPGCGGRRTPRQQICNACWRALPNSTRGRLARHDHRADLRRYQLRTAINAGTPLGIIRVSR